eukprot:CAMPEP_0194048692 /NCGR_PEP_ID=MMETSP0009_2-20130614/28143_1 /TAXON_ID=210454 /ORGANISM="Grammatophora oceanica, Strain CCMP 410" /LENGTH=57 /DNA_ID=CAMNT_0038694631 /DNA_START=508 /DNA_END=681 /DNA_ORIENTATION=-
MDCIVLQDGPTGTAEKRPTHDVAMHETTCHELRARYEGAPKNGLLMEDIKLEESYLN